MNKKTIPLWICINRNGTMVVHAAQPIRDEEIGKWVSRHIFCNNSLYEKLSEIVDRLQLTWNSEPEFIEIEISDIKK